MCNKYGYNNPLHRLREMFAEAELEFVTPGLNIEPNDEIKPTDLAPLVRAEEGGVRLESVKWGFSPPRPKAAPVINFRSDGRTFGRGKALAPATHFFEFTEPADKKQKRKDQWTFTASDSDQFVMAALWRPAQGDWPASFSLLTRDPGPDVRPFHDREIIIVPKPLWRAWLFDESFEGDDLPALPAGSLRVVQTWPPAPVQPSLL
jgi:putative SOS response-associated peptidase YedK